MYGGTVNQVCENRAPRALGDSIGVSEVTDNLHNRISELETLVDILAGQLSAVCQPEAPVPTNADKRCDEPTAIVALAAPIDAAANRVHALVVRVGSINGRIRL